MKGEFAFHLKFSKTCIVCTLCAKKCIFIKNGPQTLDSLSGFRELEVMPMNFSEEKIQASGSVLILFYWEAVSGDQTDASSAEGNAIKFFEEKF